MSKRSYKSMSNDGRRVYNNPVNIIDDIWENPNHLGKAFIVETTSDTSWHYHKSKLTRIYKNGYELDRKICSVFMARDDISLIFVMENNMKVKVYYDYDDIAIEVNDIKSIYPRKIILWADPLKY